MTKMLMVSSHEMICIRTDWINSPKSGPTSISISRCSRLTTISSRWMLVSATTTPAARLTTLCVASNTPITMVHVLDTIMTANVVFISHLNTSNKSKSRMLFRSIIMLSSSMHATAVRMMPAIGVTTVSERFLTMLNTPPFHCCGVIPTTSVICATLSLIPSNSPLRLPIMPATSSSLSHSEIFIHKKFKEISPFQKLTGSPPCGKPATVAFSRA